MKIHVLDQDPRQYTDPTYHTNCGSFSIVARGLNEGLKQLGCYAEPDDADFVGAVDGLNLGFKYKSKESFLIHVWDQINVIPNELLAAQKHYNQRIIGLSNQITNLWRKYNVNADTAMPGVDLDFYNQTLPKENLFIFDSFANVRSGADLVLKAWEKAWTSLDGKLTDSPKLIIKNTSDSNRFISKVNSYINRGFNIELLNKRLSFEEMRDLYSRSICNLNVYRHSSWGLGVQMAAACNSLPILGDFCPSNEMDVGLLLKPSTEVNIEDKIPELANEFGLHNAYGNFTYSERPRFYDYGVEDYASAIRNVWCNWYSDFIQIDNRKPLEKWTWKNSAQNLVAALSN